MQMEDPPGSGTAPRRACAVSQGNEATAEQDRVIAVYRGSSRISPIKAVASKGRILIVDDDISVRETLADLLEIVGYRPFQAADAMEALEILRQKMAISVLVTDLTMPGADGISLIRDARELRRNLPAILLSGSAEQVASVAMVAGCEFHVLRKPVASERLIAQLDLLAAKFDSG